MYRTQLKHVVSIIMGRLQYVHILSYLNCSGSFMNCNCNASTINFLFVVSQS